MTTVSIRDARNEDYPHVAKWFLEMKTGDPAPPKSRWEEKLRERTRVAELDGVPCGYLISEIWPTEAFVRNIVTDVTVRGRGVGRALLQDARVRFRAAGCGRWRLNVKPENTPAVELYRSAGMEVVHACASLRFAWSIVASLPAGTGTARVEAPTAAWGEEAEALFDLAPGQVMGLASKDALVVRVLVDRASHVVGIASFDPSFPGCFPFRVADACLAPTMLRGLRPFARPEATSMGLVAEDDEPLVELLVGAGAGIAMRFVHMSGRLTRGVSP